MVELKEVYDNIYDFYKIIEKCRPEGNQTEFSNVINRDNWDWVGLDKDTILKSKYGYNPPETNLSLDIPLAGSKTTWVYDEIDGDDMSIERANEGFPAMIKRAKKLGIGIGKIITIRVYIQENCQVSSKEMMTKAETAIGLVDYLESIGYRTQVYTCAYGHDPTGEYKDKKGVIQNLEVCIKKPEDCLNKALIYNGVSSWFFRHWVFRWITGSYKPGWGYGNAKPNNEYVGQPNTIIINNGECLNEESKKSFIEKTLKDYTNINFSES
jgi:hypothetical protein